MQIKVTLLNMRGLEVPVLKPKLVVSLTKNILNEEKPKQKEV